MKTAILGTKTGFGHVSVLNAFKYELERRNIATHVYEDFNEKMLPCNQVLCDFYNYLLSSSIDLANAYVEFLSHSRDDKKTEFIKMAEPFILRFFLENDFSHVISVAPFINYPILDVLLKSNRKINFKYHIVVTDPFIPIMVGFECPYADNYIVATNEVRQYLVSKGIDEHRIKVFGYPIHPKFIEQSKLTDKREIFDKYNLDPEKKVIVCNSGGAGNVAFIKFIKPLSETKMQTIFIAGRNSILEINAKKIVELNKKSNIRVLGFVDNMNEILSIASLLITKPGANAIFEAIYSQVPIVIDGTQTLMYQERGIRDFLLNHEIGFICKDTAELVSFIKSDFNSLSYSNRLKHNLMKLSVSNPVRDIIDEVLAH